MCTILLAIAERGAIYPCISIVIIESGHFQEF